MYTHSGEPVKAFIFDADEHAWRHFVRPIGVIAAASLKEVLPALTEVDREVRGGALAAGFISYDASPAFDDALHAQRSAEMPLLWFGIFEGSFLADLPPSSMEIGGDHSAWAAEISRETYGKSLDRICQAIYEGETYQVNYTFRMRSRIHSAPFEYFRQVVDAQPTEYAAYLDTGQWAVCSVSPELFFELRGDRIRCRPMKGTEQRGRWYEEDVERGTALRNSEKNRAENVMIVDMMRNDLGRIARPGSVEVSSLFATQRLPKVWQMTSTVEARTDAMIPEILTALFPCASITGAPKPRTMSIIADLEPSARGLYTGAIGFLLPERRARFSVAIRTVVIDRATGKASAGTGGGVVWDSTPENEYQECLLKTAFLSSSVPAFTLFETMAWNPRDGIPLLDRHMLRLGRSAEYFSFSFDREHVLNQLWKYLGGLQPEPRRIRLDLTAPGDVRFDSSISPVPFSAPARLRRARIPVDSCDRMLYHKTSLREIYERMKEGMTECDDVLLWNERGEITETTIGNILCELDGVLVTPPVASGLLPGVFRGMLIDTGRAVERVIMLDELPRVSRLYVCNALRGLQPAVILP